MPGGMCMMSEWSKPANRAIMWHPLQSFVMVETSPSNRRNHSVEENAVAQNNDF